MRRLLRPALLTLALILPPAVVGAQPDPVAARILAEEEIEAGFTLPVAWVGPGDAGDRIEVVPAAGGAAVNSVPVGEDSPTALRMPARPGAYTLRYVAGADGAVLATQAVEILPVSGWLYAVPRTRAGGTLEVDWDGPAYPGDRIALVPEAGGAAVAETGIDAGAPLGIAVPEVPGLYQLRYVMDEGATVLARRAVEVIAAEATLAAPEAARAGAPVAVAWTGPAFDKDHVAVARPWPGAPAYETLTYVREGSPLIVEMPAAPGLYEIRYVAPHLGDAVLARREIVLSAVTASIDASATAEAGGHIAVTWEGPDYRRDFLSIARAGAPDAEALAEAYTSEDSPLVLPVPDAPGAYEIRYHLGRTGRVLARHAFEALEQ
ncbi:hypothetical protein [Roseivivax isoporae]|uniref:Uncharacterized protein n=1 Tax=Roseivivax isoporae LMG 25204 TaxID=1449351 RepID=X7F694_9RHOB|nr:hypothetical protein [Roseivivax isoporae]ETX27559.1 hypothetical protein RISW2_13380 [Roseivivax isoporae LMG 25204]